MIDRRAALGSAIAVAGLRLTVPPARASEVTSKSVATPPGNTCIETCTIAHRQCLSAAAYLVGKDRSPASIQLIATLMDCAELCQATADSMIRKSSQHMLLCAACAQLCETCARSCENHGEDTVLGNCAAVCR